MAKLSQTELKILYFDVLNGYTEIKNTPLGTVYSKHLNVFDSISTDKDQQKALQKAKKMGLPTEEEQLIYLDKEGLWGDEKEREIYELEGMLNNLADTKSNLFLKSQIRGIEAQIEETEKQIGKLKTEKAEMVGLTAEAYASKKANELYMLSVLYKDKEFKELALPEEKYDELNDNDMSLLLATYNIGMKNLNINDIKRIALCGFFVNFFYLCEDNPYIFFGVPVVKLTYYQSELFSYGRYFKHLASESKNKPPREIMDDPDRLAEFYEMSKKAEEFMDKNDKRAKDGKQNVASSLVGATAEDLELLGMSPQEGDIDITDFAKSKGGVVEFDDIMKLHS
tara:strand:+ start:8998 stop:10014 length:1017 start_codon:yes stop_codon:yes gene_type:complete